MLLADDAKSFSEIKRDLGQHTKSQEALQLRIDEIMNWAKVWRMEIHHEFCVFEYQRV